MNQLKEKLLFWMFLFVRTCVYFVVYLFGLALPRNPVVILCYHSVGTDSWRYTVSFESLKRHMIYMLKHYDPVTLDDVVSYVKGERVFNKPVFAVTFDDGYADILQTVEMFNHFGIRPTAFVLSDTRNVDANELGATRTFLNASELQLLRDNGWTIGSHGATHRDFYNLDESSLVTEISESKIAISKAIHSPIAYFAYPKGRYTYQVRDLVGKEYSAAFSMDDSIINKKTDIRAIPRVGIDITHTDIQFEATISRVAVYLRSLVKRVDKFLTLRRKEVSHAS